MTLPWMPSSLLVPCSRYEAGVWGEGTVQGFDSTTVFAWNQNLPARCEKRHSVIVDRSGGDVDRQKCWGDRIP